MVHPEKVFQIGKCKISIFKNLISKNGNQFEMPKVKFEIRYKDKYDGKWKSTSSMTIHEIPKAILGLVHAYSYLMTKN